MRAVLFFVFIIFITCLSIAIAQDTYDTKESEECVRISDVETVCSWVIGTMDESPIASDIFINDIDRPYFTFFNTSLLELVFVTGGIETGRFNKKIISPSTSYGYSFAMATDKSNLGAYIVYTDSENNIWYSDSYNDFKPYKVDSYFYSINPKKIDIVVSYANKPIVFYIDARGNMLVSRFYNNNFLTSPMYTNTKLKNIIPIAMNDGYSLFLQEESTGNVFYGSRLTNTRFIYNDDSYIINNALLYDAYEPSNIDEGFALSYTTVDAPNYIKIVYTDYNGEIINKTTVETDSSIPIMQGESKVEDMSITKGYHMGSVVLYSTEDNNLYLYMENKTINLSTFLGKVSGDISITTSGFPYYYILYYSIDFNELKVARLNLNDFLIK